MEQFNLVEMTAGDEEQSFNQACKYGNLVDGHAVYCHSPNENSPRKCRRTWYTDGDIKDEDCPFYAPNDVLINQNLGSKG